MSISDTFVVVPFRDSVDGVRFIILRVVLEHFKKMNWRTCVVQQGGPVEVPRFMEFVELDDWFIRVDQSLTVDSTIS